MFLELSSGAVVVLHEKGLFTVLGHITQASSLIHNHHHKSFDSACNGVSKIHNRCKLGLGGLFLSLEKLKAKSVLYLMILQFASAYIYLCTTYPGQKAKGNTQYFRLCRGISSLHCDTWKFIASTS